jgi:hypothetical protein
MKGGVPMMAHQKAAEDMRKIAAGEVVSGLDLVNIRACLVYETRCLGGLDPEQFSVGKVINLIDENLAACRFVVRDGIVAFKK